MRRRRPAPRRGRPSRAGRPAARSREASASVAPRARVEQREQRWDIWAIGHQVDPVDPHPAERPQALGTPLARKARVALARVPGGRVHVNDTPALRILERDEADVRKLELARVVENERDHIVLVGERAQRGFEFDIEEVGEHKDNIPLLRHVRQELSYPDELGARSPGLGEEQLADDVKQVVATRPRRKKLADPVGEQHQTDPVVVVERRDGQERGDVGGKLALGDTRRAEPSARGHVDGEVDVELALLAVLLYVGDAHPRGDVPVDGPDIVSRLVLAHLLEVEAQATENAAVRADHRFVGQDARLDLNLFYESEDLWRDALAVASFDRAR